MVGRILVTPRSLTAEPDSEIERLKTAGFEVVLGPAGRQPSEAELMTLLPGCTGWLAGVEPVSPAVIEAAGALRIISRNGVGTDNLPLEVLAGRGIEVAVARGANATGVAELAIGLMFAALRHIPATDAGIKAGHWPRMKGREIAALTVGVIGCGAVGRRVAEMAAALGARVAVHDPADPDLDIAPTRLRYQSCEDVFACADVVSLHCPPLGSAPLADSAMLAQMKPGAVLVNTARASLVDAAAVLAALEDGQLGSYATDLFEEEPPKDMALAAHPRVIATAHIGGFTAQSVQRATRQAVDSLIEALVPHLA